MVLAERSNLVIALCGDNDAVMPVNVGATVKSVNQQQVDQINTLLKEKRASLVPVLKKLYAENKTELQLALRCVDIFTNYCSVIH